MFCLLTGDNFAHFNFRHSYNGGLPEDPYGTRTVPEDPYATRGFPQDPYNPRGVPEDPYGSRGGIPEDPYGTRVPEDPYSTRPEKQYSGRGPRRGGGGSGGDRPACRDLSPGGPPHSPRGSSPMPRSRELSPVRYQPGNRAMSPPPELRNSYFPNKGLPGYLASEGDLYGGSDLYEARRGRGGGGGGPKYTASSLGLTERGGPGGAPPPGPGPANIMRHGSGRDEGYRSMDRQGRPLSGQYYDNPYASMDRMNRAGAGVGPPPGAVDLPIHSMPNLHAPSAAPYMRDRPRRGYDEMPPPDYAMRGGGGFDYLP